MQSQIVAARVGSIGRHNSECWECQNLVVYEVSVSHDDESLSSAR